MRRQIVKDFGTSLFFDGAAAAINAGSFANFCTNLVGGSFTIAFWCKSWSASGTINYGGFSNGGSNTAILFHPNRDESGATSVGKVNIFMRDNSNIFHNVATTNSVNINNGRWRHVIITGTPSTHSYQIYIDGVAVPTSVQNTANPTNWNASTFGMGIGVRYVSASPTQFFPGNMDDVRFYTTALSSTDAINLYYGTEPSRTSLFAWYKFDEGSGSSATDASGNGNTGTITSATYSSDVVMKGRTLISLLLAGLLLLQSGSSLLLESGGHILWQTQR